MTTCLHPVILQSRPDGDMTTVFHSFFFLKFNRELNDIEVERRLPSGRARIEDLEIGLKMSLLGSVKNLDSEMCSSVVVSTSDGGRYYCTWRGFKWRIFVGVSKLAATSFTRQIFMNLQQENPVDLPDILLTLTETPVVPASGLKYTFQFSNNSATLDFSSIEQLRDPDLDMLVFRLFSPQMLVAAWEAVILEKKMMIISRTESVVGPCCEFIRRLVLPLTVVSTFIPSLPAEAAEMLESPVPYIVGVQREIVEDTLYLNYPDTIVVDLDAGTVMEQQYMNYGGASTNMNPGISASASEHMETDASSQSGASAPSYLVNRLVENITKLIIPCLGRWHNRPCFGGNYNPDAVGAANINPKMSTINETLHPLSSSSVSATVEAITTIFIETNLSLISARSCNVRAFFRRPESRGLSTLKDRIASQRSVSSMGFDRRDGIICGCMQLLRERNDDDMLHFLPCWVGMDGSTVVVYEHADELPLLHILSKNVKSVSPSPMEPEGHVFELEVKNQSTFRFAATGPEARRAWIEMLEAMAREAAGVGVNGNGTGSTNSMHALDVAEDTVLASEGENDETVQEKKLTEFRLNIMQTQMVSYIRFRVECDEYTPVLQEINGIRDIHTKLEGKSFERGLSKHLWTGNTVCNILSQIHQSAEVEEDLSSNANASGNNSNSTSGATTATVSGTNADLLETALRTTEIGSELEGSTNVTITSVGASPPIPIETGSQGDAPSVTDSISRSSIRCSVEDIPIDSNMSPFNNSESVETKKKGGFFSFLGMNKNSNNSPGRGSTAKSGFFGDDDKKAEKLQREKEREVDEAKKTALRNLLHLVAASYRRCEAELSSGIVESRMKCQEALINSEADSCFDWMDTATASAPQTHPNDSKNIVVDINRIVKAYRKEVPNADSKGVLTKLMSFKKSDKKRNISEGDISNYALHCPTYWFVAAWEHVVRIPAVGIDRLMELVRENHVNLQQEKMDIETEATKAKPVSVDENSTDVDSDDEIGESTSKPEEIVKEASGTDSDIPPNFDEDKRILMDFLIGGNGGVNNSMDILGIKDSARYEDAVRVYWEEEVEAKKFGCIFMNTPASTLNSVAASPAPHRNDNDSPDNLDSPNVSNDGGKGAFGIAMSEHDQNALETAIALALEQEKKLARIEELVCIVSRESDLIRSVREEQCKPKIEFIRKGLVKYMTAVLEDTKKHKRDHLMPILQSMLGYVHYRLCNYEEALQCYSIGNFVNQKRVMFCVSMKFLEVFINNDSSNCGSGKSSVSALLPTRKKHSSRTIRSFLKWATNHGHIVGLQAYRLLTEFMHKRVAERLSDAALDENTGLNKKKIISFPRVHMQSFARKKYNFSGGGDSGTGNGTDMVVEEEGFRNGLNSGALSKARGGLGVDAPDFTYATPSADIKTDVLNEVVICVVSTMQPCELSIQLLTKLREILRAACEKRASTTELSQLKNINASNWFQMPIVPAMLSDIISSSAYRSFELQASQLQKVDLASLNDNEKLLFFTNVYNITTVHGFIVKGLPGKNLYERTSFMRSSKYNVGGFVFSLVEIEHGILRAASSSPMLFGPFSASMAFSEKDNRLAFALKVPKPLVSFCLFTASGSSPPLIVLRDPIRVDDEMRRYSMSYMEKFVFIETHLITRAKTVWLPDLIRFYWKDFGGNRAKVLHNVMKLSNRDMQSKLDSVINSSANVKPKVNFVSFDWSEMIVM